MANEDFVVEFGTEKAMFAGEPLEDGVELAEFLTVALPGLGGDHRLGLL